MAAMRMIATVPLLRSTQAIGSSARRPVFGRGGDALERDEGRLALALQRGNKFSGAPRPPPCRLRLLPEGGRPALSLHREPSKRLTWLAGAGWLSG